MFGINHELKDMDLRKDAYTGFKIFPPIPYSYSEYDLNSIVAPPGAKHLLGTDEQGRDLSARMIHGSRVSILIGFIAVAIYVTIGIIIGSIAGYYGGVDRHGHLAFHRDRHVLPDLFPDTDDTRPGGAEPGEASWW